MAGKLAVFLEFFGGVAGELLEIIFGGFDRLCIGRRFAFADARDRARGWRVLVASTRVHPEYGELRFG